MAYKDKKQYRLPGYSYAQSGSYFVTICVRDRVKAFGRIENSKMMLSDTGRMADEFWQAIPSRFENVILDEWIVMPDHVHGIIIINGRKCPGTFLPSGSTH